MERSPSAQRAVGALALDQLREAMRYVIHMESLLALGVLALFLAALERAAGAPLPGAWLAQPGARVLALAYFYLVYLKATVGKRRLPRFGNYIATWESLIMPLFAAATTSLWLVAPVAVAVRFSVGWRDFVERLQINFLRYAREPYLGAYLSLGWVCFMLPPTLLALSLERRRWSLLDPLRGFGLAWRLGPRLYAESLAALHALTLAGLLFDSFGVMLAQALPIPFVAPLLGHLLVLWVPLAQARLWGDLVHENREALTA